MNRILFDLFEPIFFSVNAWAQTKSFTAVINDPDHYTYVRASENGKIIDKLVDGQMFYVINENVDPDWYQISYPDPKKKKDLEHFYKKLKKATYTRVRSSSWIS
ncbi:hypothetical protein ACK2M7_02495 [Chryseobacterium sp. TY4]